MKRHFNTHIEGIDLEFWRDLIEKRGSIVTYNAGDVLCEAGERSHLAGFVESGYFTYNGVNSKGIHILAGFAFPGALVGNYPFCMYDEVSMFNITAAKKSQAIIMDCRELLQIFQENIEASNQGRKLMESAYQSLIHRYMSLYSKTPKERYIELISEHPQIMQVVTQKEIAKYLQITPVHLCRIRKELMKE